MGKSKDLPAVDFHAMIARRDPQLAERMVREGVTPAAASETSPLLAVVPSVKEADIHEPKRAAPPAPHRAVDVPVRDEGVAAETSGRRRGIVPRSGGREAGRITVYVPPDLALRLRKYCFEHDRSITDVAGEVLIEALEGRLGA